MHKLKSTTETVISVDYSDLDMFIQKVTGQDYECVADQEWGNDSEHRFVIDGQLDEYYQEKWEAFKKDGSAGWLLRTILNGLCADKLIPAGTYLIKVCW